MALSDKTRKILWARSGNLCALCRKKLVIDPTQADAESVIGEECHIYAQSAGGPRFSASFPADQMDSLENLILLCASDHKRVDDQPKEHSVEWLKARKAEHEKRVEQMLTDPAKLPSMSILRTRSKVPQKMNQISSGKFLLNLSTQCHSSNTDYDDDLDDEEMELVAGFLQDVSDYRDIAGEVSLGEHMRIARSLSERIKELEGKGFYYFVAVEGARVEGGERPPQPWMIFHQLVTRVTNPRIVWTEVAKDSP